MTNASTNSSALLGAASLLYQWKMEHFFLTFSHEHVNDMQLKCQMATEGEPRTSSKDETQHIQLIFTQRCDS